jgi:hypothetical protein
VLRAALSSHWLMINSLLRDGLVVVAARHGADFDPGRIQR